MSWASFATDGLDLRPSPLESARFGISVSRLTVGWEADERAAATFVGQSLASAPEQLLIARWPTHLSSLAAVAAASPRRVLVADVLVYWEAPPERVLELTPVARRELSVSPASSEDGGDAALLEELVRDSFQRYGNHYLANPDLDPAAALDGYVEWAQAALSRRADNVLLLREERRAVGLATLTQGSDDDDLEVELAGLRGNGQGRGLYAHLLRACAEEARRRGSRRLLISTQVQNVRVQRAWARAGLVPFAALSTAHASLRSGVRGPDRRQGNHTSAADVEKV